MALVVGVNSYVDVAYADAYFADRLNSQDWIDATPEIKEQSLISATQLLDSLCVWSGNKTDPNQPLEFPRDGEVDVPEKIKISNCEIAFEMISQNLSRFVKSSDELKQIKAGSASISFYETTGDPLTVVNSITRSYLKQYGSCDFGNSGFQVVGLSR